MLPFNIDKVGFIFGQHGLAMTVAVCLRINARRINVRKHRQGTTVELSIASERHGPYSHPAEKRLI